ncbi:hypothetical protein RclHR1_21500002 [Rhizophagus clarus]|uniref:Transcription factor CBF/NF-Y/archaeal histone domain-containing protein n=1 Tax=Rhizophagus clarus TaxID=94130 RepID=A0A2Z6QT45_9GLOM|nr:hypothetical protein RclHR1_21500002 [Rhizophagus clarus]GET00625.1 hypothetical protein GLOIN_2v1778319 [Rhizophagus clarus]
MPSLHRRVKATRRQSCDDDDVDVLFYLHCKSFIQKLAHKAHSEADSDETKVVERKHVEAALEKVLQEIQDSEDN